MPIIPILLATAACPVHIVGKRIVDTHGRTVYRDPGYRVVAAQLKCRYRIPQLVGYRATRIRVGDDKVAITARSDLRIEPRRRIVTSEVR